MGTNTFNRYKKKKKFRRKFEKPEPQNITPINALSLMEQQILFLIDNDPNLVNHPDQIISIIKEEQDYGPPLGQVTKIIEYYNSLHQEQSETKEGKSNSKHISHEQFNLSAGQKITHTNKIEKLIERLKGKKQKIVETFYNASKSGKPFDSDRKFFSILVEKGIYLKNKFSAFYQMNLILKNDGIILDFKNSEIHDYTNIGYEESGSIKAVKIIKFISDKPEFSYKQMFLPFAAKEFDLTEDKIINLITQYNNEHKKNLIKFKRGRLPKEYQLKLDKLKAQEQKDSNLEERTESLAQSKHLPTQPKYADRWVGNKFVDSTDEQILLYALIANRIEGIVKTYLLIDKNNYLLNNGKRVYFSFVKCNREQNIVIDAIVSYNDEDYIKKKELLKAYKNITYIVFTHEDLKNPAKAFEEKFAGLDMKKYI